MTEYQGSERVFDKGEDSAPKREPSILWTYIAADTKVPAT